MIIARCEKLKSQLNSIQQMGLDQEQAAKLKSHREEIERHNVRLKRFTDIVSILKDKGHLDSEVLPSLDVEAAQSLHSSVLDRLSDPSTFTQGNQFASLLSYLNTISNCLEVESRQVWNEFAKTHLIGDESFLEQVGQLPGQQSTVNKIREARENLKMRMGVLPDTDEKYQNFISDSEALKQALSSLNSHDFPQAVLTFFAAAQTAHGAPIELLTQEVRTWLEEKDMLTGLRVRFGGGTQ